MTLNEKKHGLRQHIGYEQIADIHDIDAGCGMEPSKGRLLAELLIENAANQTGIWLEETELKEFITDITLEYNL